MEKIKRYHITYGLVEPWGHFTELKIEEDENGRWVEFETVTQLKVDMENRLETLRKERDSAIKDRDYEHARRRDDECV